MLVAIADVNALVTKGSAIDEHVGHNTTSVYTAAELFPMLPEKLSTDRTSLGEDEERRAIVVEMLVRADGAVAESDVYRARVLNRAKLVCRYAARPAVATERIERLPDGRLLYRLRHRWRDGSTAILFEPQQLMQRLVPLIPAPRAHLVPYHGVLTPCTGWRDRVVPIPAADERSALAPASTGGSHTLRRYAWANLLRRVFAVDVLECPDCGGPMRILAAIHPHEATRAILECLGLPSRAPPTAPARPDPEHPEPGRRLHIAGMRGRGRRVSNRALRAIANPAARPPRSLKPPPPGTPASFRHSPAEPRLTENLLPDPGAQLILPSTAVAKRRCPMSDEFVDLQSPVRQLPTDRDTKPPVDGVGLCLSGGGYRAMVFHAGALWRLHEMGLLREVTRISSVSGGSITAGVLGLRWGGLYPPGGPPGDFEDLIVGPVRRMASDTIDVGSILAGRLLPGTVNDRIVKAYRKHLFGDKTLQDLPDEPRFIINATNVQSGALWRFSKKYMRDWRVGEIKAPDLLLATAVAASSAFPPVLSPAAFELDPKAFTPNSGADLQRPPFTTEAVLTDGGVYDNLGLETVWKRCRTVLVSDAGGKMAPDPDPKRLWGRHILRVLDLIDNQVRSLRKRQVFASYDDGTRDGAFWDMRMDIADFKAPKHLACDPGRTADLAATKTRLKAMPEDLQERLINWGYAICDAVVRSKYRAYAAAAPPADFPYPRAGV